MSCQPRVLAWKVGNCLEFNFTCKTDVDGDDFVNLLATYSVDFDSKYIFLLYIYFILFYSYPSLHYVASQIF